MTISDNIALFCGAQVSPNTAKVYSFQMHRYAGWLQREHHDKIEKATTAYVLACKAALSHLALATKAHVIATGGHFIAGRKKWDPAAQCCNHSWRWSTQCAADN